MQSQFGSVSLMAQAYQRELRADAARTRSAARPREALDEWGCYGALAGAILAADERHEQTRQWGALWRTTHSVRAQRPGAWRRWLGTFLVRAGTRLQGLPLIPVNATPAG
jgi:hypothetical protein